MLLLDRDPVELPHPTMIKNRPCHHGATAGGSQHIQRRGSVTMISLTSLEHSGFERDGLALRENNPIATLLNFDNATWCGATRPGNARDLAGPEIALDSRNDPYQTPFISAPRVHCAASPFCFAWHIYVCNDNCIQPMERFEMPKKCLSTWTINLFRRRSIAGPETD